MPSCPCCRSSNLAESFNYNNHAYSFIKNMGDDIFEGLRISVCLGCGFGFAGPVIPDKELINFYNHFYSHIDGLHSIWMKLNVVSWKNATSLRSLAQIFLARQYVRIEKSSNILEVGPGYGDLFAALKQLGETCNFFAVEEDLSKAKSLKNLGVKSIKSLKNLNIVDSEGKFDLIVMSHVLEHFQYSDLEESLKNMYSVLSNKGAFLIEVPGDNFLIDEREVDHCPHLCFFTVESLRVLLTRIGFEVCFIGEFGEKKKFVKFTEKRGESSLRDKLKKLPWLRLPVRFVRQQFLNILKAAKVLLSPATSKILSSNEFVYGENLRFIRVVLRKP
jgi:SAM-dependent methyltransferase